MRIPVTLLLIAGIVGGNDVIYFHLWKFRLYSRVQSRREEVTHLIRGAMFPLGLAILLIGRPEGAWFWFVAGLLAIDSVNSLLDTLLEPASRAPIGVPPAELGVHYLGVTLMGAAAATFVIEGWTDRGAAAELSAHSDEFLPDWVFVIAWLLVILSIVLVVLESTLFIRHVRASPEAVDGRRHRDVFNDAR